MSVNKKAAFVAEAQTWGSVIPTESFKDIIDALDAKERVKNPNVSQNALNNCHGDWYEWLIASIAWNLRANDATLGRLCRLPNVQSFDVAKLYNEELNGMIEGLRSAVRAEDVGLVTSNPDFVIIRPHVTAEQELDEPLTEITLDALDLMDNAYKQFEGKCGFEDIAGFVSVKLSLRSDRRLQLPHEGSFWKAMYGHLRTRQWIVNPRGFQYHAIALFGSGGRIGLTEGDKKALTTVATHSMVAVTERPERAVDSASGVTDVTEGESVLKKILEEI